MPYCGDYDECWFGRIGAPSPYEGRSVQVLCLLVLSITFSRHMCSYFHGTCTLMPCDMMPCFSATTRKVSCERLRQWCRRRRRCVVHSRFLLRLLQIQKIRYVLFLHPIMQRYILRYVFTHVYTCVRLLSTQIQDWMCWQFVDAVVDVSVQPFNTKSPKDKLH